MRKGYAFYLTSVIFILASMLLVSCEKEGDIVGKFSLEKIISGHHNDWYKSEFDAYQVDISQLAEMREAIKEVDIDIYLGTWCSDSQRELPRFIKILEELSFDKGNLSLFGLDREKKAPEFQNEDGDIEFVPTFIFYKNGKEMGRIIESPMQSLEIDMKEIILNE